jgi:hypothetical protein
MVHYKAVVVRAMSQKQAVILTKIISTQINKFNFICKPLGTMEDCKRFGK